MIHRMKRMAVLAALVAVRWDGIIRDAGPTPE